MNLMTLEEYNVILRKIVVIMNIEKINIIVMIIY